MPPAPIPTMLEEISAAAEFIANLPKSSTLTSETRDRFRRELVQLMAQKFRNHWNVDNPMRGNGFRSIMTSGAFVDPLILTAARAAGVQVVEGFFPSDFVMWIDPHDVSYRIGEFGSVCPLFEREPSARRTPADATKLPIAVSVN